MTSQILWTKLYHKPKLYRYQVARVDIHGPLSYWRGFRWNQTQSGRIGALLIFGNYAYCVKWASSVGEVIS